MRPYTTTSSTIGSLSAFAARWRWSLRPFFHKNRPNPAENFRRADIWEDFYIQWWSSGKAVHEPPTWPPYLGGLTRLCVKFSTSLTLSPTLNNHKLLAVPTVPPYIRILRIKHCNAKLGCKLKEIELYLWTGRIMTALSLHVTNIWKHNICSSANNTYFLHNLDLKIPKQCENHVFICTPFKLSCILAHPPNSLIRLRRYSTPLTQTCRYLFLFRVGLVVNLYLLFSMSLEL